ncbi:thioredoxin-like protein [Syncephalastrum racemosum]|uniref:Thioredoxin n=1 Tax=Syncephalastrum racemosum TaxID=13706 RepID=A0A1X2H908_SYNRA|nr:thioredoxin-like protein [Syncephalastrum racemosum]
MREVKDLEEFNELIKSDKVTAVDFTATWCGPCKVIGPIFEKLAEEYPDYTCIKVDVDDAPDIAQQYGIRAMPTFTLFSEGEKLAELVGANPRGLTDLFQKGKESA